LGKAQACRHGGSMSKACNAEPKSSEVRPTGAAEKLASCVVLARFGTTKPSPPRLAGQLFSGSVS
jgi:hypothetical protein